MVVWEGLMSPKPIVAVIRTATEQGHTGNLGTLSHKISFVNSSYTEAGDRPYHL